MVMSGWFGSCCQRQTGFLIKILIKKRASPGSDGANARNLTLSLEIIPFLKQKHLKTSINHLLFMPRSHNLVHFVRQAFDKSKCLAKRTSSRCERAAPCAPRHGQLRISSRKLKVQKIALVLNHQQANQFRKELPVQIRPSALIFINGKRELQK